MKPIFIHHRSSHHAVNSGYSRLIDFYQPATVVLGQAKLPYKVAKVLGRFVNQEAGLYNSSSVFKELELLQVLKKSKNEQQVVHYLNAERDVRFTVQQGTRFNKTAFCGSFHKPPKVLENHFKSSKYIKHLDGAVAVGINQVDYIQDRLKIKEVTYIPHGVDTQFFKPKTWKNPVPTLLFVGQHLRNFDLFNSCIPVIAQQVPDLKVEVVMHKPYIKQIKPQPYIQFFSGLDDQALSLKYQQAHVLFLPMIDGTACNSILEAMASGLPIVTTDVGGNSAYLEGSGAILAPPKDANYLIDATVYWLRYEQLLQDIAIKTRAHALQYDWKRVADLVKAFHGTLF
ncbi:glycosyltransferase family 4 protein [Bizionia sediminis]|uniref:Glycosyltransferase family 4 protein n=1 Tax=Bizionia sediminis TaxID=1737064 RepID=A0ABW5KP46_9FLAO